MFKHNTTPKIHPSSSSSSSSSLHHAGRAVGFTCTELGASAPANCAGKVSGNKRDECEGEQGTVLTAFR